MSLKFAIVRVFTNEKKDIVIEFEKEELQRMFKDKVILELREFINKTDGIVDQIEAELKNKIMMKVYKDNKHNMAVEYDKEILIEKFKEKMFRQLKNKEKWWKRSHKKEKVVLEIDSIFEQIEGELKQKTVRLP